MRFRVSSPVGFNGICRYFCAKNTGPELAGKTWVLKYYGQLGGGMVSAITDHEPNIVFDPEKMTISGNGGVNGYGGDYTVDGSKITFKDIIQTLMASTDENLNKQESTYFNSSQRGDLQDRGYPTHHRWYTG